MESQKIVIRRGLNIPIKGEPAQVVSGTKRTRQVAVLGIDYTGMKPHLSVSEGDAVRLGQVLFIDRKMPSVKYTSPGSGKVVAINRGPKRMLQSVVIRLEGDNEITFNSYSEHQLSSLRRQHAAGHLLESGLWTSLRTRPFSRVPDPESVPNSIFVTAMDTNPLAPSMEKIMEGKEKAFANGLIVLSRLTDGKIILCKSPEEKIPYPQDERLVVAEFSGPHPAGNAGTHIHYLDPVGRNKQVWYIHAQDVAAVGVLFTTGRLNVERIIALSGPSVKNPRLVKTVVGADVNDLMKGELKKGDSRIISGSVLSGHTARGETAFLGRYHHQISVVPEGGKRDFLGWLRTGFNMLSGRHTMISRLFNGRSIDFTTSTHGERRAVVPTGAYEKVMPLDIMPTHLLKALEVDDIDEAERLGCLELDEEDLALCTFVCPSKIDHGAELRRNLMLIEKEG